MAKVCNYCTVGNSSWLKHYCSILFYPHADRSDLLEITEFLSSLEKTHVLKLGLALGLDYVHLKNMMDSSTFLYDVVSAWLRREDNVNKRGLPSWKTLIEALKHRSVGQNGIAAKIEQEKLSAELTCN